MKNIDFFQKNIRLEIWDSSGSDKYKGITKGLYKGIDGFAIIYDVTNRKSFEDIEKWIDDIKNNAKHNASVVIVGNKNDVKKKQVTSSDIKKFCKINELGYIEVSAKKDNNVCEIFYSLIENILETQYDMYNNIFIVKVIKNLRGLIANV